jgi:peroxiredoxin
MRVYNSTAAALRGGACICTAPALRGGAWMFAAALSALCMLVGSACGGASEPPLWTRPGFYGAVRPEMGPPQPGSPAPELALLAADGTPFRLSQQRGSWVVLHFTATWCPFCDAEVDRLGELAQHYAARGVKVVLVDVEDDEATWTKYRAEHVAPLLTALWDRSGEASRPFAPLHAQPSFSDRAQVMLAGTLVIDREGTIRLFTLPDSKHFDPALTAERGELDRMLAEDGIR